MKIILLKDTRKIGRKYEIKEVADGYALNSLIPQGAAVPATPNYLKSIEERKKHDGMMKEEFKKTFEYAVSKLPGGMLHIARKVNEKGHLFAGLHKEDIIENFKKETGIELPYEHLFLDTPIKEVGEHTVAINIDGAKYDLKVSVKASK